jgi:hypothetical protein
MKMFYDPNNPSRGALAVPQGDFQTEIELEEFEALRASLSNEPTEIQRQDLEKFIAYCFSGENKQLTEIFTRLDEQRLRDSALGRRVQAYFSDLMDSVQFNHQYNPVQSGGWGLALTRLAEAIALKQEDREVINQALQLFNLPEVL